ncbi:MAG: SDR family oxidoreductase [Alphaproteobacteria bacterium]|nr:SDR family oxidoreductase [Alphaproteobacteria bacterium]
MRIDLDGKVALVSGAGRGNGRAIALGLAAAGAAVAASDIDAAMAEDTAAAIRRHGGKAVALAFDVSDAVGCRQAVSETGRALGRVALLVNNAGVLFRRGIEVPEAAEDWRRTLAVNLDGMFNLTQACLADLKASQGRIVNIASTNAFIAPKVSAAYAASKGGVVQLTKALAVELAADGVRCNAVAPGIFATEMTRATREDPERLRGFLRNVPMGRYAEPEELVGPVLFLLSDWSSYITGHTLVVDGGLLCV